MRSPDLGALSARRSRGWSSALGPEAGVPIRGPWGRCPQPGLATAGLGGGGRGGPTWRVERGQFTGPGVLRAPAPAIHCFIIIELRLLAQPVLGARHGHSPGPPGALCWQRQLRRQGRGTAARSRRPMTAQRRGRWRRRRGPRPAARHSQSGPAPGRTDQSAVAEPQPTAEHRGQGRSWAQLGAEAEGGGAFLRAGSAPGLGPGSCLTETRAVSPPTSCSAYCLVPWARSCASGPRSGHSCSTHRQTPAVSQERE